MQATAQLWYAGTWDSTVYNRSEHPKTVAVRVEVMDVDTGLPVKGATVELKGQYDEETIGPGHFDGTPRRGPQRREFKRTAQTGGDGVAVLALGWKKEYPWDTGRPQNYDVHTSWTRAVDDVEKVQTIEIRHGRYREAVIPFDFSKITQIDRDRDAFRNAWAAEIGKEDVRFCILDLGTGFSGFKNTASTRPEFFETIRKKEFGTTLSEPQNYFSFGEHPQSECGPYFVYLVETRVERLAAQVEVAPSARIVSPRDGDSEDDQSARRWQRPPETRREEPAREPQTEDAPPPPRRSAVARPSGPPPQPAPEESVFPPAPNPDSIGLAVTTLTGPQLKQLGLYQGVQGALILGVAPDSPAARAGLAPGMVIESIDQRFVGNASDYSSRVGGKKRGDQFDVGVWEKGAKWARNSKRISL
jgi:hypothetical protein